MCGTKPVISDQDEKKEVKNGSGDSTNVDSNSAEETGDDRDTKQKPVQDQDRSKNQAKDENEEDSDEGDSSEDEDEEDEEEAADPFPEATQKMNGRADERKDYLTRKLVTPYRAKKNNDHRDLQRLIQQQQQDLNDGGNDQGGGNVPGGGNAPGGNAPATAVNPEDMKWGKIDHALNDSGFATGAKITNALVAGGDAVANSFFANKSEAVDADRYGYNSWDALYSGMGALGNTARLITNSRKRDKMNADIKAKKIVKKNEAEKKALFWDSFANTSGLLGNLSEIGVAGAGFFDTDNNKDARLTSKILAPTASWFNAIGSIGSAIGKRRVNSTLVEGLNDVKINDYLGPIESSAKAAASNKRAPDYLDRRAEYKNVKARKYAIDQAQRFHESNGKGLREGDFNTVFSSLSAIAMTAASFSDKMFDSPIWKGIKGALPLLSIGVDLTEKLFLKGTEKNRVKRNEKIRQEILDEYIEKKRHKIYDDAKDEMGAANAAKINENEYARIAVARLGVAGIEIENRPLDAQDKTNAFDLITDKRAQNILDSPKADREQMLDALFLPPNATKNDIIKALNGGE